jgi:hypothetical protein
MIYIAHRGNFKGKHLDYENNPNYIIDAINKSYDVEIDLWKINNELFLGHDKPDYKIDINFFIIYQSFLWTHVKNIDAIEAANNLNLHWFWHENDTFTLTSKKIIWPFIDVFIKGAVVNQPTKESNFWSKKLYKNMTFKAICDDDVESCKKIIEPIVT